MYRKNTSDLATAVVTAALGAGIVTSFAVNQGQHPLIALAITGLAVAITLVCDRAGLL
ncbi:hypothetical protein NG798_09425 [Ancylothrix sp. C2]|uniref:hypothetical protein n=1 Tax=Ancylothrix sp. D3o TaxID=2953691 RepID=UPI0021BA7E1E|nr:hypothetical protein [Ancylothrix sp. D3o]MCT7950005.1 hypothetical protein [Ancylothrix sp. D3o]